MIASGETSNFFFIRKNSDIPIKPIATTNKLNGVPPKIKRGIKIIKATMAVITRCFIFLPPLHPQSAGRDFGKF